MKPITDKNLLIYSEMLFTTEKLKDKIKTVFHYIPDTMGYFKLNIVWSIKRTVQNELYH